MHRRGFTIVELLIVIVVIAILAAITIVAYNGIQDRAKKSAMSSGLSQAARALELAKTDNADQYPSSLPTSISAPAGTTYVYNPNYDGTSSASYCLSAVSSTLIYRVTNTEPAPQEGEGCAPRDGLVGWWPLNGNATDFSGSAMTSLINGATSTAGQTGAANTAYGFNGTSNYISLGNTTPINFTNTNFTVSAWIRLNTLPATSTWYDILSSGGGDWSFGVNTNGSGVGYAGVTKVSQTDAPNSTNAMPQNVWHHVVATYTYGSPTSSVFYYMNGTSNGGGSWNHSAQGIFVPGSKRIGARSSSGYFNGTIDDVRVYNRVLSVEEIRSLAAADAI